MLFWNFTFFFYIQNNAIWEGTVVFYLEIELKCYAGFKHSHIKVFGFIIVENKFVKSTKYDSVCVGIFILLLQEKSKLKIEIKIFLTNYTYIYIYIWKLYCSPSYAK